MADPQLIKVCLTNKGEDTETPWAADLGPAGSDGSRKVKLVNVPFMHAKPTWGDTIIVKPPRAEGPPTWDREGVPWKQIATKIVEDGGRWAMIVDYAPTITADEAFAALGKACDDAKIVCEGAWGPREREPGRVYLAVQKELNAEQVMGILIGASLPMELIQIHPEPKKRTRAQTQVGISDDAGRPPAAKPARAKTEPPVAKAEASQASRSAAAKPAKSETTTSNAAKPATASNAAKPASSAAKPASSAAKPATASSAAKPASSAAKPATASNAAKPASSAAKHATASSAAKPASSAAKPATASNAAKPASSAAKAAQQATKPTAKVAAKPAAPAKKPAKPASAKPAPTKSAAKAAPAKVAAAAKSAAKPAPAPAKKPAPAKAAAKPAKKK